MSQYTTFYKMKVNDAHSFIASWDKLSKRDENSIFSGWAPENEDLYIKLLKEFPRVELGYLQNNYRLAEIIKSKAKVRATAEPWFLVDELTMSEIMKECVETMITINEYDRMPYALKSMIDWSQEVWEETFENFGEMPKYILFVDTGL